ncbi:ATP-binding cassette domain-containing protein [Coraliomargarita sp. SDUM461003]|uniref:ATP-binding cassette domain-containing protein n=1 Tax=Thalassobacterium maritimum TaxID=3041265 RepID=A0ABU1AR30_9BACT|nr:ATP-binding cassette domain-containing protein [Coraliomargarita sp. SDUM461003]MDQ8206621.1 ATP-binding cassette domain-containing protein [Coraliomargarita sp. SDUM461003]
MLACKDLTVEIQPAGVRILDRATALFKPRGLNAVIGPSGCGKTTLVKAMLGILPSEGAISYAGEPVRQSSDLLGKLSFAPQFSIAHERLSVAEALCYALDLCVRDRAVKLARLEEILRRIGLAEHRDKRVSDLSGGQLRRLGLGLELVGDPQCMVCDEVTSGLDPRSEDQILAVLERLRDERGKTFICIIHNLAKLDVFDWITVVYEGAVVFQGTLEALNVYFNIPDALHLYDRLNEHSIEHWRARWGEESVGLAPAEPIEAVRAPPAPGALAQTWTLLIRRALLFKRDRGYWLLTLGITLGFPLLVTIFAWDGIPQLRGLSMDVGGGALEQMEASLRYRVDALEMASLVTGLILFQVILLTLMGSNNGAREIAGERQIFEKERFAGLSAGAYASSKLIFASFVAVLQGLWMMGFVKYICEFPGASLPQAGVLVLSCVSMTAICLGFSAIFNSADKASLLSVYLVGFQLPLSGIVLALPDMLVWLCRPFINAYWGWAGYFGSMRATRLYDAYRVDSNEWIPSSGLAASILLLHFLMGAVMVFWGCQKKRWN